MLGAMLLQSLYGPKPDVPIADAAPAAVAADANRKDLPGGETELSATGDKQADGGEDAAGDADAKLSPADGASLDAEADDPAEADGPAESAASPATAESSQSATDQGDSGSTVSNVDDEDPAATTGKASPSDAFVKLGSLVADGSDRYLVTVNQNGGTLHQVELNFRDKKGNFRYRDLVHEGGYLGSFNTIEPSGKITVISVGSKTPADLAGLKKDDIIQTLNGEPMVSRDDIEAWLHEKTKIDDSIEIGIVRDGSPKTLTATLTDMPISVIRPEGDLVDPNFDYPESFIFSVIKPGKVHERWPDLDKDMREGRWEVTDRSNSQMVELKYEIPSDKLQALELPGPLTAYKRYRLPKLTEDDVRKLDSRTFHLELEIEIKNESDQDMDLAYELDGPTGTSAETWWYANKIHGRQTAVFYTAGARDVVGATATNSYVFWGRPEIVDGATSSKPTSKRIADPMSANPDDRKLRFAGVDSHYFNVSLIPQVPEGEFFDVDSVEAYPVNRQGQLPDFPKSAALQKLIDVTFQMVTSVKVPAGESHVQTFDVFAGPKEPVVLEKYGLDDTRTFGWFGWCSMVLLQVLHFFYYITFEFSYGLAIILLTVLVRCIMIPFSRKAALNAQMMQHLSPQIKEINEKYGSDLENKTKATQELYKKYKFNPLSGCFMMFFQLPIFYGLYKALNVDIALRDQPFIPGLQWCSNLAAPDQFLHWESWMPAWLADETGYLGPYLNILPILTMVLFILQQKLFTPPATDDQQKMMQKMMMFMMLFMGFMFFKVPSGLCLYFITSSLWAVIERTLLPKPKLDTDKLSDMGDSNAPAKPSRADRKQEARTMREEAERLTQTEERRKRNADRKKRLKKRGDQ